MFEKKIRNFVEKKLEKLYRRKGLKLKRKRKNLTFTFWWFVAKNIQNRNELSYVCSKLYLFYRNKMESLVGLGISDIVVLNNTVFIDLLRPGLFIGKMGSNIEAFEEELNTNTKNEKAFNYRISIIEDNSSWWKEVVSFIHYEENYF